MSALFASGHIVDFILALTVAEGCFIALCYRCHYGPPLEFLLTLLSGMFLLLALRCALAGAGWHWIALSLLGALVAHAADLRRRWH